MNDATASDVYTVMGVEGARSDEVRGKWGRVTRTKGYVASKRLVASESGAAWTVGPPFHGG